MGEGWLRHLAGDRFEVFSAGLNPTKVNPLAIRVMGEAGVDISKHSSKSIDNFIGENFAYVITVCDNAKGSCPHFMGERTRIHWDIDDPADAEGSEDEKLIFFRKTRDILKEQIEGFIAAARD